MAELLESASSVSTPAIWVLRLGSGLLAFVSLGFGIPAVFGAAHLSRTGEVWTFMGFPTYGPSFFGAPVAVGNIVVFAIACAVGFVGAVALWWPDAAVVAAIIGVVALAAQAVFWIAFALPFGPPLGIAAAAAIIVGLVLR
jgi:hypothetical protein